MRNRLERCIKGTFKFRYRTLGQNTQKSAAKDNTANDMKEVADKPSTAAESTSPQSTKTETKKTATTSE